MIAEEMTADPSGECAEEVTEETAEEVTEGADEEAAEEQTEEMDVPASEPKQKPKVWMVILAVIGAIALVGVLLGAVAFGVKSAGKKVKSYTVSDDAGLKVKDVVVATVGDVELTNSELQIYYWQAVNEFYEYYGYYMDLTTLVWIWKNPWTSSSTTKKPALPGSSISWIAPCPPGAATQR